MDIPRYANETTEQNSKDKTEYTIQTEKYLELHGKRYLPLKGATEKDKIEKSCVNAIRLSKKEPQSLVETKSKVSNEGINERTFMRLWLYEGKIYEVDRNDYDKQQVKLLILDFLDKERRKFQELKQKYESKKGMDSG